MEGGAFPSPGKRTLLFLIPLVQIYSGQLSTGDILANIHGAQKALGFIAEPNIHALRFCPCSGGVPAWVVKESCRAYVGD